MKNAEIIEQKLLAKCIATLSSVPFETSLTSWIEHIIGFESLIIIAYFQNRAPQLLWLKTIDPNTETHINDKYITGLYLIDPLHSLHVKNVDRGIYRFSDVAPDRFLTSQYFNEYYRHTVVNDEIAIVAYPAKGVSIHVCLSRDKGFSPKFTAKEIRSIDRKVPIITSLVESHWSELDSTGTYSDEIFLTQMTLAIKEDRDIHLTPRQSEVVLLILRGHSSVSIGVILSITYETVKVFRKQIYKKCKISSEAELFQLFVPYLQRT